MKRLFRVFRNRSDLPEMTLPLVVLTFFAILLSAVLAVKSAASGSYGLLLAPLLLLTTTTAYALLILLWRKLAALAASPLTVLALLLSGASLFSVAAVALSTLFLAYTVAVSALSGEGRYRRMFSLSLSVVAAMLLCAAAWVGLHYDTLSAFLLAVRETVAEMIQKAYAGRGSLVSATQSLTAPETPVLSEGDLNTAVSSLLAMIPAAFVMTGTVLAWLCDGLFRAVLKQLGAIDDFLPRTHRITLPRYYAAAHLAVTVLMLWTPSTRNPLLYAAIRNLFLSLCLPCLYVGCVKVRRYLMIRLYFFHGKRTLASLLLFMAASLMGVGSFLLIFSFAGAVLTLRYHRKMRQRVSCRQS